ncbi:MAG: ABC transporter permease [Alphaproteobacteria bacterium]
MKQDKTISGLFKTLVLSPTVIWLGVLFVIPMGIMWLYSFGQNITGVEIAITGTLDNYIRIFDIVYLKVLFKSLLLAGITTFICLVIGFIVALHITSLSSRWQSIFIILIMLPFWINMLVRTYALIAVFRGRGFINVSLEWLWEKGDAFLNLIGLGQFQLLGERFISLELLYNNSAVILGLVYAHLPFMILPLFASLNKMDKSYLEASYDLGAGHTRTIFHVILPMIKAGIVSGIVITFIPVLGSYLIPDLLGGNDSIMISNIIAQQFKMTNDWPFGAALSFVLMYLTLFILVYKFYVDSKQSKRGMGDGII